LLRLVLKPLLVILTLGALLVALFQVAGRVAFIFLDSLELAVNQVLSAHGMRVTGLSGDWRMLNPVLLADRVDLPAGHLQGLVLEVDVVESVLRATLLARRLKVTDAEVALEKRPGEPWRLRGATAVGDFDPRPVLEQSDQLELAGQLTLTREGAPPARIAFSYLGLNRGGEHRHALELSNPGDCLDRCLLQVNFQRWDQLWPVRPGRARLTARSDGFLLPRPVLGISPLEIAELDLHWQQDGKESGGAVTVRTEQLDMPGDVTLAVRLRGTLRGRDGIHAGSVTDWQVEQGDEIWTLPDVSVAADADGLSLWMPQLDIERTASFVRQTLAAVEPAERWLGELNLRGTARNVRLGYGFDGAGLRYALTLDRVAMDGYKGIPTVVNAGGELFGFEQGLQINLNAQALEIAFPDVFTDRWRLPYAQGVLQTWFRPGYFGIRGLNLRVEAAGTRAAGGFAMTRPQDREGQRLLLLVGTDRMAVQEAQRFVPYKLPEELKDWLQTAPRGGVLEDARLAYQGQFQEEPGELGRRIALAARVHDGHVRYHPDWPEVTGVVGRLEVAGPVVEMDVERAESAGARLDGSQVSVLDNASSVSVSLDAETRADAVLDFLRTTPLATRVTFIEPDWQADGPIRLSGELQVPLNTSEADAEPAVRLRGDLAGVDVRLPGYRIALQALDGSFRYRYPYQVDASAVTGRLFDAPVTVAANTARDHVHLYFTGQARPADVWRVIDMADPGVASGVFDFEADLGLGVANDAVTTMVVSSSLEGTAVTLPGGYGKPADAVVPAQVQLSFLPDYRAVRFDYRDAAGWLHFDQAPLRGAIGFDAPPMPEDNVSDSLVLGGRLSRFELDEVIPDGDGDGDGEGASLLLPIRLDELEVAEIGIGSFAVTRATLDGLINDTGLALTVDCAELTGSLERSGDEPMQAALERVTVPVGEDDGDGERDPLNVSLIAELPDADVSIEQLTLGAEDYGRWRFLLRPVGDNLEVRDLEAAVRGVAIEAAEGLVWHGESNETRFEGTLRAGNLAEVLPQWGYAPNVETGSASLTGEFTWSGSPLMVDLLALRGEARARAAQGRFLDVESGAGAQKIFSLLNFTAIAKRVSLNFSDVFGRGVSFDELDARFSLDEGLLEFLEPMEVDGTGSEFRVTGTVDMAQRRLDNEMIVTLPVTKSLPWYAAYVALANPLAGLGVLVGERVLRKPLEQFSSARYRISGTLDDPEVKFVSVFDVTPATRDSAPEGAPDEGPETDPGTDDESADRQPSEQQETN
jgi:uncharacterized protein (TIGR02099 family)